MTITEAIENIKDNGNVYTDENLKDLEEAVLSTEITGFTDPKLKEFIDFVNIMPFHDKIQEIITAVAMSLSSRGIMSPCMGGCSGDCVFHDAEFGV